MSKSRKNNIKGLNSRTDNKTISHLFNTIALIGTRLTKIWITSQEMNITVL